MTRLPTHVNIYIFSWKRSNYTEESN
uniref:Uncharacterized protein n=1 Tax=Arundo donax TaxID=35708 RepID=A0A0A8YM45_ARUDO